MLMTVKVNQSLLSRDLMPQKRKRNECSFDFCWEGSPGWPLLHLDELDHPFVDLADSHEDSEKDGSDDNSKRDEDSEREDETEEESGQPFPHPRKFSLLIQGKLV